jgi:desulfoferrodoxin-like iron-binding protein|tara:strand:- start:371 stop:517 length:147 start_codon:yes stop_codon:yes gene_type:complete
MQGKEVILMAAAGEVFVCEKCGNMVVVIKAGGNPEVHCCGEAMKKKEL